MSSIKELIQKIENPSNIHQAFAASGPHTLMIVFDMDETVQKVVESRDDVEDLVLKRIRYRDRKEIHDISMACFCYILGKKGSRKAVAEMANVLAEIHKMRKLNKMSFAKYFAIHTVKVLEKQPDIKNNLAYSDEEVDKTIKSIKRRREGG